MPDVPEAVGAEKRWPVLPKRNRNPKEQENPISKNTKVPSLLKVTDREETGRGENTEAPQRYSLEGRAEDGFLADLLSLKASSVL